MQRRKFLEMFAKLSVGVPVAQQLGLWGELHKWVLGPKKTIFVPPENSGSLLVANNELWASGYCWTTVTLNYSGASFADGDPKERWIWDENRGLNVLEVSYP